MGKAPPVMDLVTILERVPPLLRACVDNRADYYRSSNRIPELRALRLTNKECSRVALLGLGSYALALGESAVCDHTKDTNVGGVRLLRGARLEHLHAVITLSGSYSPALLLEDFVREVDSSLSTVTSLDLHYKDTCGSTVMTAVLDQALSALAGACPSLKSLEFTGALSTAFLCRLGDICPLLTALTIHAREVDPTYLQRVLLQQPTLLPNISSLTLLQLGPELPDFSQNSGILSLKLANFELETAHWLCMPPNLQHLHCLQMNAGPPTCAAGRKVLNSLISIRFSSIALSLHALAQILHEGPFPQQISTNDCIITCDVNPSTPSNLRFLHQQMQMGRMQRFEYTFKCSGGSTDEWFELFVSNLPSLIDVVRCELDCSDANLLPMLQAFPDLQKVTIRHGNELTDIELYALTACAQLTHIELVDCTRLTPMGLLPLCQHLSKLHCLYFWCCDLLCGPQLELCMQLLGTYNPYLLVVNEDAEMSETDDLSE